MKSNTNTDIRRAMKEAGMKYADLARIMNKSEPTVYRLIAGELSKEERANLLECIRIFAESGGKEKIMKTTTNHEDTTTETNGTTVKGGTQGTRADALSTAEAAEACAVANGAKSNDELRDMLEDLKKTEFTPEEKAKRRETLAKIESLTKESEEIMRELPRLKGDIYNPANLEKCKELKSRLDHNKTEIEQLKKSYPEISCGHIRYTAEHAEIRKKIEYYCSTIPGAEKNIEFLRSTQPAEAFKQMETLEAVKATLEELQEEEKQYKPEVTPDIRKKVSEFQTETRKALMLKLKELSRQMEEEVQKAWKAEREALDFKNEFLNEGLLFPVKDSGYDTYFMQSFYMPLTSFAKSEAFFDEHLKYYAK